MSSDLEISSEGCICRQCGTLKPWSEFYRCKSSKTGHEPRCRDCSHPITGKKRRNAHVTKEGRVCLDCGIFKSWDEMGKVTDRPSGRSGYCKKCLSARNGKANKRNPEHVRRHDLAYYYNGFTPEEYDALLAKQNGVCAICHRPEEAHSSWSSKTKPLSVDHDHVTQKVRGLLCCHCNRLLGAAKDNVETLLAAVDYLRQTTT